MRLPESKSGWICFAIFFALTCLLIFLFNAELTFYIIGIITIGLFILWIVSSLYRESFMNKLKKIQNLLFSTFLQEMAIETFIAVERSAKYLESLPPKFNLWVGPDLKSHPIILMNDEYAINHQWGYFNLLLFTSSIWIQKKLISKWWVNNIFKKRKGLFERALRDYYGKWYEDSIGLLHEQLEEILDTTGLLDDDVKSIFKFCIKEILKKPANICTNGLMFILADTLFYIITDPKIMAEISLSNELYQFLRDYYYDRVEKRRLFKETYPQQTSNNLRFIMSQNLQPHANNEIQSSRICPFCGVRNDKSATSCIGCQSWLPEMD